MFARGGSGNRFPTPHRACEAQVAESPGAQRRSERGQTGASRSARSDAHAQSKWGRPEGRPHSHQRVVLFRRGGTWRPVSLPLVRDPKIDFRWRCHRRSHRHPVLSDGWSGSEDPFRPIRRFRDRSFRMASRRWRRIPGRSLEALPDERPGLTDRWLRCFAFLSNDRSCFEPKFAARPISKTARTVAAIPIRFEIS